MNQNALFTIEAEAQVLRNLVKIMGTLVDEAKVVISRKGIHIKAVDPAHVSMVELTFGKDLFEKITVSGQKEVGLDIDWLDSCLKMAMKRETVILKSMVEKKVDPDRDQIVLVFMSNGYMDQTNAVDTTGMSEPKLPNLNLKTHIKVNYNTLAVAVNSFAKARMPGKKGPIYDHMILRTEKNALIMECEGETRKSVCQLNSRTHDIGVKGDDIRSLFPLDYLNPIIQNMKDQVGKDGILNLRMGDDYPIDIMAEGDDWKVQFLLAPRIESE